MIDPSFATANLKLAFMLFSAGVLIQSYLLLKPTQKLFSILLGITIISCISFIISIVAAQKSQTKDLIVIMGAAQFFYFLIFGIVYFNVILPNITESFLLIYNTVFLYFLHINGWRIDIFLLPSIIILINAFVPARPPNAVKFLFYIWYLLMSVLMLFVLLSNKPGQISYSQLLDQPYINFEWMLTFMSAGMIYLYIFVNAAHILIPIFLLYILLKETRQPGNVIMEVEIPLPDLSKDNNQKTDTQMDPKNWDLSTTGLLKTYLSSIYSKYQDEDLNPLDNAIIFISISFILAVNYYVLHLNDTLVVNAILLFNCYNFGKKVGAPLK